MRQGIRDKTLSIDEVKEPMVRPAIQDRANCAGRALRQNWPCTCITRVLTSIRPSEENER